MDRVLHLTHQPVLLQETLSQLNIQPDGIYIDATFGRGGHSAAILSKLGLKGRLLSVDQDPEAHIFAKQQFTEDSRFFFISDSFSQLKRHVEYRGWVGRINGILLDLGVSSPQLNEAERGFSFLKDGPLDMRMNPK
jgi:16S rRNA (cytosine1402-N4)-methyltransferase